MSLYKGLFKEMIFDINWESEKEQFQKKKQNRPKLEWVRTQGSTASEERQRGWGRGNSGRKSKKRGWRVTQDQMM